MKKSLTTIDDEKLNIESLAVVLAAAVHRPSPDMSGDIWKALGEGMHVKYRRIASELVYYLTNTEKEEEGNAP